MSYSALALIPARAGSVRIPKKNTRRLNGHPLLAYTIAAAQQVGIFTAGIYVSSEDPETLDIARYYGAQTIRRPDALARAESPDIRWVRSALESLGARGGALALLRPTSPFRTAATIQRAWKQFIDPDNTADTLRAVEPVSQHPGKMWAMEGPGYPIVPILNYTREGVPWHSCPTQTLPTFYVQNASLEMAWIHDVLGRDSLTGRKIGPFFTEGYEGVDLNTEADWTAAAQLAAARPSLLPPVSVAPYGPLAGDDDGADSCRALAG